MKCLRLLLGLTCAVLMVSAPSYAGVTFTLGNNPLAGEENILFAAGQSGTTVSGSTQSGIPVVFSSTLDVLTTPSNGQAKVEAQDGTVNNISLMVPNGCYTGLILNPFFGSGTATVTVETSMNFVHTYTLGNGQNFLTIDTTGGEKITQTTIDAPGGFTDLRQPRIVGATVVPEPGSMAVLALGGLPLLRRLRRRRAAADTVTI